MPLHCFWFVAAYLRPLIKAFESYTEITVKSQYLHSIGLSVRPKQDEANRRFTYTEETLPHLINPIEGYLSESAMFIFLKCLKEDIEF